jgi:large subunit ribosomal protein L24
MKGTGKRPKLHIRKGDLVVAISGEDADGQKVGKVLQVFPEKGRAVVEGFNYIKKHVKKSQDNPQGGIVEKEAPLAVSKLKLHTRGEAKKPQA